ncbi:hypothetical protein D3C75_1075040 [compost metagenome]
MIPAVNRGFENICDVIDHVRCNSRVWCKRPLNQLLYRSILSNSPDTATEPLVNQRPRCKDIVSTNRSQNTLRKLKMVLVIIIIRSRGHLAQSAQADTCL